MRQQCSVIISDDDSCKVKIIRNIEKMPLKDYFDVQEVEEEVLSEDAKHAKVIEFVYQVRQRDMALLSIMLEFFFVITRFTTMIIFLFIKVTRKSCDPGEYTGWLQDGK